MPREHILTPGVTCIGRKEDNDIVVIDNLVSRAHAEIHLDNANRRAALVDLGSANGTYVNHKRLPPSEAQVLRADDAIRIGSSELRVSHQREGVQAISLTGSHTIVSQALVLESFDRHAVLLYEIIDRLNKVFDAAGALQETALLMRGALGVEKCEIVLQSQFDNLASLGFPTTYASRAIQQREAIFIPEMLLETEAEISVSAGRLKVQSLLCVPVVLHEQVIGLIYLYNTSSEKRLLDKSDLHVAVAVAHLAALTLERVDLVEKLKDHEKVGQLLKRFLPPIDAQTVLDGYIKTGNLPELTEQTATVLFSDIANSTHLAEKLGPKRYGAVLRRYYQEMTNIVFEQGGLIDKYLGDGVMAVFGLSSAKNDMETRAIQAGLLMLERLEMNFRREGDPINIGVAVNSGPVMAGYVVTQERVELTVVGDTVNVAARLQAEARPNRLFVGPLTYAAIHGRFDTQRIGPMEIRGRTEPVEVQEVIREPRAPSSSAQPAASQSRRVTD